MPVTADDHLIEEWFRQVRSDDQAKQRLAAALRSKNQDSLRAAVGWVVENLIKPGVKVAWDVLVKSVVRAILGG